VFGLEEEGTAAKKQPPSTE
jgi:hypothetical protein